LLARLGGDNYGVLGGAEVLGGVLVFRGVAAADVAAGLANAQVHPRIREGYALGAGVLGGWNQGFEGR
jgi:hypothetical protein